MPSAIGSPPSFITSSAQLVAFPVPTPLTPVLGVDYHNQGVFHVKGVVTINYNNTSAANEHMDWVYLGVGYLQLIKNDDYRVLQVAASITVPAHTSGSFTAAFDADVLGSNEPFGKDPPHDMFCGPGEFWVGLLGSSSSWSTDSGTLLQITSFSVEFTEVRFDYSVVSGSFVCGSLGACPRCTGPGSVPTGHPYGFTFLCATKMTGVAPANAWKVTGPGLVPDVHASILGQDVSGWTVNFSGCSIIIQAPCQDFDPALLGTSAGLYTVVVNVSGVGWVAQFELIYTLRCTSMIPPPPPGAPNTSAIEADGPRQLVHLGSGASIQTYDAGTFALARTGSYPVDQWRKLRFDARFGSLAGLARTYAKDSHGAIIPSQSAVYSVWLSTDGGATANKVSEMSATSSILERDSERNWLLWLTADTTNQVSLQISTDGGQTYAAMVDVQMDDGSRMQAALLDSCQDCRSGGRVALVCAVGKDPAVPGPTHILVSDDGGLTFRQVV